MEMFFAIFAQIEILEKVFFLQLKPKIFWTYFGVLFFWFLHNERTLRSD